MSKYTFSIALVFISLLIAPIASISAQQDEGDGTQTREFGGVYSSLKPEQQRLVVNWFERYNKALGEHLDPEEAYNQLPQSEKTTFDAVTNALWTTKLTDEAGAPLGSAIDLIEYLERVRGRVKGTRGDVQFRIYAALKDNAIGILDKSREFQREGNNTVYHKGYPMNYRQQGGAPSMQISIALDGKRADIDVDYRSSSFPAALLNGHLSASNSDVRAGNNYDRHVGRWSGLTNWWRNLFGLPLISRGPKDEEYTSRFKIASVPRISDPATVVDAARDFLTTWLVEEKPAVAMAYFSQQSYACINQIPSDEELNLDPGITPHYILKQMRNVNEALGKPATLADVIEGVRITKPELKLKVVPQDQHAQFVMYAVPETLAMSLDCAERAMLPGETVQMKSREKYGEYFGTSLRVKIPRGEGSLLYLIWAKEGKYWKIVSWDVEPVELEQAVVPEVGDAIPVAGPLERTSGDPQFLGAVQSFFSEWFIKQDYPMVAAAFTEETYPCINYYRKLNGKEPLPEKQVSQRLRDALEEISNAVGRKQKLRDAIQGIEPSLNTLKLVSHPEESSYVLVDVPDEIATAFVCTKRTEDWRSTIQQGKPHYGNYYGSIFQLNVPGEPAVLALLWSKRDNRWKVMAFSVEMP